MNADGTILVGISGSPASRVALRWAADEAERRESRLEIILIWQREQRASYAQQDRRDSTECREDAWSVLTETVQRVLGSGPLRNATVEVVEGRTEQALVTASEDADLLVLGSGPAAVTGPVVRTCLAEAHCPVVVVGRRARPTMLSLPAAALASPRAAVAASR
jgi:nucleotide-binding universal stress UspA family protein